MVLVAGSCVGMRCWSILLVACVALCVSRRLNVPDVMRDHTSAHLVRIKIRTCVGMCPRGLHIYQFFPQRGYAYFVHVIAEVMSNQSGRIYEYVIDGGYSRRRLCGRDLRSVVQSALTFVCDHFGIDVISQCVLFYVVHDRGIDNRQSTFKSRIHISGNVSECVILSKSRSLFHSLFFRLRQ